MIKKLINGWYDALKREYQEHVLDVTIDFNNIISFIKRYTVWLIIGLIGVGLIWFGLSQLSAETRYLNRIVTESATIEQSIDKIVQKEYANLSFAQKSEQRDALLKANSKYRGLQIELSMIETNNRNPVEVYGYIVIAFCLSILLAAIGLFVYTKHNFVKERTPDATGTTLDERKLQMQINAATAKLNKELSVKILGIVFVPVFIGIVYLLSIYVGK